MEMNRLGLVSLCLVVAACGAEGRRLVPAWPGPHWEISGKFCEATSPRLQCCLDRDDRWVRAPLVRLTS